MKSWKILITFFVLLVSVLGAFYARREPNFTVEWKRRVPTQLKANDLAPAIDDPRLWPVYHHGIRTVQLEENGMKIDSSNSPLPGRRVDLLVAPKGKEWKKFLIRAEVTAYVPGKRVEFRLLEDSTGKTPKILEDLRWSISIVEENGKTFVEGDARGFTKTARARFFARVTPKILMNHVYPVDLVRLANFIENQETWAKDYAPSYR